MNHIYLERHEPGKDVHRFYQLFVIPSLFGDWALIREWGRVGSPGTVRKDWFDTETAAIVAREKLALQKQKKGYQAKISS